MQTLWSSLLQRVLTARGMRLRIRNVSHAILKKRLSGPVRVVLLVFPLLFIRPSPVLSGNDSSYRLIGTIKSRGFTGAVLDNGTGGQVFYRLREQLPDGSRIVKVENNTILLKRSDGSLHELFTVRITSRSSPGRGSSAARSLAPKKPPVARGAANEKPNYGWGSKKRSRRSSVRRRNRR